MWSYAWREVRWRLALMVLVNGAITALMLDDAVPGAVWMQRLGGALPMMFMMNAIVLAGVGVSTQISQRPGQVVHASMLFVLSLPITRRRLVLVREAVGVLAALALMMVTLAAFWFGASALRNSVSTIQAAQFVICVGSAMLVAHGISAVWATLLDQLWQTYAALGCVALVAWAFPSARFWGAAFSTRSAGDFESGLGVMGVGVLASLVVAAMLAWLSVLVVERKQF